MDQVRQNLLVYVETNKSHVQEKIYNDFHLECIQKIPLKNIDVEKLAKSIREVFQFANNSEIIGFFKEIQNNIRQFISKEYQLKTTKKFHEIDIDKLSTILQYCVINGIQPIKTTPKIQPIPPKIQPIPSKIQPITSKIQPIPPKLQPITPKILPIPPKLPQMQQILSPKREIKKFIYVQPLPPKQQKPIIVYKIPTFKEIKPRIQSFLKRQLLQQKPFKIQRYSMPNTDVRPKYLQSISKPPKIKQQPLQQVQPLNQSYLQQHKELIKQRLLNVFIYYCTVQLNVGRQPTFDRIREQCHQMSLGKFLRFCKASSLFKHSHFTKQTLINCFKRVAEGKLEIDFALFQQVLRRADGEYLSVVKERDKVNLGTYEARLHLQHADKCKELTYNIPFSKGEKGLVKGRELTSHSGKFSFDLKEYIKEREKMTIEEQVVERPSKIISLKDKKWLNMQWFEDENQIDDKSKRNKNQ